MSNTPHPGRLLRNRLADRLVIAPGAFNALVARAVARAGFDACYISGGATANVAGYPDIGLITLTEMCRTVREISQASALPVIADADTGYGEVECAVRTIIEYDRAGAAALHVEDQVFPKRCGHLDGKELLPIGEATDKVRAMSEHRLHDDFVLIARTDARGVDGLSAAIDRGNQYRDTGADIVFPEGLQCEDEFAEFARQCPGLLLANMTEFGKTPDIPAVRFAEMGYQLVIYPLTMMRLAMNTVTHGLKTLKREGSAANLLPEMQTRADLYDLLDYTPGQQWNFPSHHQQI